MSKNFNTHLGECMRTMRERKKLTIIQVAELMGVSKVSIHYWECGKRQINASSLKDYCNVIGVRIQDVFDMMDGEQ